MSFYIGKKAEEEEAESSGDENQDDDDEEEEEEIIEESGEEDEDDDDDASSNEEEEEGEGETNLLEAEQKRLKELKGQTEQSATKEVCTLLEMTSNLNHLLTSSPSQFRLVSIVQNNDNYLELDRTTGQPAVGF